GMARPLTERTRWCSSRAKVFGRGRGGGRSGDAGASFGIVAIRAILADRGIVRRGRAGPGPRVVARRVPADPAHAGALGDAAAAAPQPGRHDRRRAADRADDAGGGDARQLQVTFKLRPGARWSDGQPVTARDVVFTWQLALNPTLGGAIDTERRLEKVEASDDATVVFTFFSERSARAAAARQPNRYGFLRDQQGPVVDPLYAFGLPDWWVYPAHALGPLVDDAPATSPKAADALAKGQFARQPVGAGPFRLASWAAGDRLTLAARSDYHGGAPRAKTLVLKLGTTDALRAGLRDGDVDLLLGDAATGAEPSSGV